ncbi:hypothetical protein [Pseudofrankia sp. DC12]|uniref:hypothetical protein n=1 Tax=Pseudofrankia sp. DC12 TaxID=683315 RepID=UPI0005F82F04|nr:hypothetical protein [Pseudofrankia sp. DC12]
MAIRPGRRLRPPPAFPAAYQSRRRRPSWWSPVAAWAGTHRVLTGVGLTGLVCIAVALVAGGFLGHSSTPSAPSAAVSVAPAATGPSTDTTILAPIETPLDLAATAAAPAPTTTTSRPRASTAPPRVVPTAASPRRTAAPVTTSPVPATTKATPPTQTTTSPAAVFVHAGDDCSQVGAVGVSELGTRLVCGTTVTSPTRPRWHSD